MDEKLIALITEEVVRQLTANGRVVLPDRMSGAAPDEGPAGVVGTDRLLEDPADPEALERMKKRTTARIGVGKAGARLKTATMLALRADHARAQDSVFADVDPAFIERLGLLSIESQARDRNTHITRPDLGRKICPKGVEALRERCKTGVDVQIYASDGLSSAAIEANLEKILPVLTEGLQAKGLTVGTPFYMRFGRVAAEDQVAEVLGAKVVCVLIGERPGLATAESMSAYIVYNAYVGIPEAKRTVVSNIHKDGLTAVEAGAYITEVIQQILDRKASGVDLVK
ncbi:MAG: ethanolamine ammonia-lyase subunit EutC [Firmicutes bacterium]|nr:ethanolamine ammonia-lyase subunit EutC [Bacillota bacterium]